MVKPCDPEAALRARFDAYLRCPTAPALAELEQALRAHQTEWIRARAGGDAPVDPARAGVPKPRFKLAEADVAVLARIADGWAPTMAELPRWAWFEDRELLRLDGEGALILTAQGWHAIGRQPPA